MDARVADISPVPSEEEAAAIAAAVTMMWPRPCAAADPDAVPAAAWRFSGRWWSGSAIARRGRPGR